MILTKELKIGATILFVLMDIFGLILMIIDFNEFWPLFAAFIFVTPFFTFVVWKIAKTVDKMPDQKKYIEVLKLTYVGGGLIDKQKDVNVIISKEGLQYGLSNFISIDNIEGLSISNQEQVTSHIKSRLTVTRLATFGILALAMPKHKVVNQKFDQTYLTIDYTENDLACTLVFKGPNVQKVMQAIKKAKQLASS